MIPAYWNSGPGGLLWQVMLHSTVAGIVFYAWARRVGLPSGRPKQQLLTVLLVLPLVTAAMPGRHGADFRDRLAWFDSSRVLAIPLVGGLVVYHLVLLVAAMMVVLTVWQEVLPALRRRDAVGDGVPEAVTRLARSLPGWSGCEVVVHADPALTLATGGWPRRPRLMVSRPALDRLTADELAAAIRHEHAHWRAGRWLRAHILFAVRLLQPHNPVALSAFREACLEMEIECDAAAVEGHDPRVLAAALLKVYEATDRRDLAARGALRRRIDILLDGRDAEPGPSTAVVALASAALLVVLPWVV